MDAKKIGIIALAVVALGLLAFSFKSNFMNGPTPAGQAQAEAMKKSMQDMARKGQQNRGGAARPANAVPANAGQ
ncbi:MAG TPA: hypothetical protein VFU47_03775 [Armatimonadota bacterium]|nr:hypothetical protein [Armatimonadota bacterium]